MKLCDFEVGENNPLFLIAGPCVIESESLIMQIAEQMKNVTQSLGIPYIFKSSFDKANRSSLESYRGPGIDEGLRILEKVKNELDLPILTDIHEESQAKPAAEVVSVLQTPAFLCRQSDFIQHVCAQGKPVNIKKAQFMAPLDMQHVVTKARATGNDQIMLCERGTSFGYNTLVSDMRSLPILRQTGCPVVFDATHSVQMPGGLGTTSGGQREMVPVLARAACAVGIAGIFMETHPDPANALSDGPNSWPLQDMLPLLTQLKQIDELVKAQPFVEDGML